MSQAESRRDRSKTSDDECGVPSPENSAECPKSAVSPLSKIVFIQKVALFAGTTPKKALQLIYVTPEWREAVVDFTFDALFFDPFVKPLLLQQPPSTSSTEKEKEMQQQNEQKKLELFKQFRKVVIFLLQQVSADNKDVDVKMKTFLAILFDFVHGRKKNNNNNNSKDDDSSVATNAGYHEEVASFLRARSLRSFLRIDDLHDLIINHIAPHVTAIDEFGELIFNIVQDRRSAELFSNVESFSAILKCFHRSKTSNDAYRIASSIYNIFNNNPFSKTLLNSLPVVEAFSFIIPLANDDDATRFISNALLRILDNNDEAQPKFATAEFFQIFQGMEKHATTNFSKIFFQSVLGFVNPTDYSKPLVDATNSSQLDSAVDSLPRHEKYFTEEVRDLLIAKKDLIVDAATADAVVKFLKSFSRDASLRPLLRTEEVQDFIINHIAPHVTAIHEFGGLIFYIVRDEKSAKFFSNVESFAAILKCFHRSTISNDAYCMASSINNIILYNPNPSSNKLLNSLPIVEAFSFIIPLANNAEAVQLISEALRGILNNNEEAQKKFATPEFLKIFQRMKEHITSKYSNKQFETVLELLTKKPGCVMQ
jgi:hypothetical protein